MRSGLRRTVHALDCLAAVAPLAVGEQQAVSAAECTFRADPDAFLAGQARARQAVNERVARLGKSPVRSAAAPHSAAGLHRRRDFRQDGRAECYFGAAGRRRGVPAAHHTGPDRPYSFARGRARVSGRPLDGQARPPDRPADRFAGVCGQVDHVAGRPAPEHGRFDQREPPDRRPQRFPQLDPRIDRRQPAALADGLRGGDRRRDEFRQRPRRVQLRGGRDHPGGPHPGHLRRDAVPFRHGVPGNLALRLPAVPQRARAPGRHQPVGREDHATGGAAHGGVLLAHAHDAPGQPGAGLLQQLHGHRRGHGHLQPEHELRQPPDPFRS